jgi:ABC-2 family transporter protein
MIWLTWRQARVSAVATAGALVVLAVFLGLTGPGLADEYATGIAACTREGGDCSDFVDRFFREKGVAALGVTAILWAAPALIGIFWGAPLIARELETGTHRLVWNQSVTRTRWLAVKLGLLGLGVVAAVGLGSFAVDWWSDPIDKAAHADDVPRLEPLLFAGRGIVPIAYAVFAFALGATAGMLVRRTVPAMAITLAVFVALQFAMPTLVRPHLSAPVRSTFDFTGATLGGISFDPQHVVRVDPSDPIRGAWILSSRTVDSSGNAVETIGPHPTLSPDSGACAPPPPDSGPPPDLDKPDALGPCAAEVTRLGYRLQVTYHPGDRFWRFQFYESAIYLALAFGLAGFCLWWLRHRLS